MSRHRAFRNRTYSYDDDYDDDYDDEEEEEYEDEEAAQYLHPSSRPQQQHQAPQQAASLSSYFDAAASGAVSIPSAPGAQRRSSGGGGWKHDMPASSPDSRPLATISEDFDADLVGPAFQLIKASGQAPPEASDERIRNAIRQANYDADAALVALLGTATTTAAAASSSRGTTPSPPPRPSSAFQHGGGGIVASSPLPPQPPPRQQQQQQQEQQYAFPTALRPTAAAAAAGIGGIVRSSTPEVNRSAGGIRARTPPSSSKGGGWGGLRSPSPLQGETGVAERVSMGSPAPPQAVTARPSLSGINRDADVWEEDVLPSSSAAAVEWKGEEEKPRLSLVVIGHVDAGKSTLMGQVLVATGLVSEREVRKYEREAREMGKASFYLAWLMDEDSEERAHGVTMEVAHKRIELSKRVVTLLDAPGHQDFIPQMITGAVQADVALLVVPASTGEFEAGFGGSNGTGEFEGAVIGVVGISGGASGGQTKEHALLARSLGVTQLLVAINKLDAAEPPWSQVRYDSMVAQLGPFLEATGFKAERIRYVPVSGLTGENVKARSAEGLAAWYSGPTLLEAMDELAPATKLLAETRAKPLRLFVTDVVQAGKNVAVAARAVQGLLRAGSKVLVLPIGDLATVRSIEVEGRQAESVQAGEHADLTLQGVDISRLAIGDVLCKGKHAVPVARRFLAQISVLPSVRMPILRGTQFQLHMQSLEVAVHTSALVALLKKPTAGGGGTTTGGVLLGEVKQERPRCLMGGALASVELRTPRPICLERYEDSRALGRFVLRQKGETVAVGVVLEVLAG